MDEAKVTRRLADLEREVERLKQKRIYQRDVVFSEIKQVHIDGLIIFRGDSSDRPVNGKTEVQAYYSEDTKTLSIWNTVNSAWEDEVFT